MTDKKKQLVFNIIDFIRTSANDGTVKEADKESLEVAVQCLSEAFEVDPDSAEDSAKYSIAPATLPSIFDVFLRTKSKTTSAGGASTSSGSTSTPAATAAAQPSAGPSAEEKARADALKAEGNALMARKPKPDLDGAIEKYTEAIALDAANPVYWSNRAAAYGARSEHSRAISDAEEAVRLDPSFSKGWSRLGHAHYSLGDYQDSVRAYKRGLEVDPSNKNMQEAIKQARIKLKESGEKEEGTLDDDSVQPGAAPGSAPRGGGAGGLPDLSALAGMLGGGAGGAGGGGMPDLASLMQNPALMQMAQQMMANGGLESLMQNPALRGMADRMQSGGGMPDLASLANDPAMRDLAQQYMGGGGAGGQGGN